MTHQSIGRLLLLIGGVVFLTGIVFYFLGDRLKWLGNLPGDIRIERDGFKFYFPLTTMILISLLLNVIFRLWQYFK